MSHTHNVVDTDKHFIIDAATRAITTESKELTLMQGDHNSEIYTFEMPRRFEGHDMSECNRVEIHYINTSSDKFSGETSKDYYIVSDLRIDEADPEKLLFSWLLSGNTTKYAGSLGFRVSFSCVDDNSTVSYKWSTDIFKGITVSDGLDNTAAVEEAFSDVFTKYEEEIEAVVQEVNEANAIGKEHLKTLHCIELEETATTSDIMQSIAQIPPLQYTKSISGLMKGDANNVIWDSNIIVLPENTEFTFNLPQCENFEQAFTYVANLTKVTFRNLPTHRVFRMLQAFWHCDELEEVDFGYGFDTEENIFSVLSFNNAFSNCGKLKRIIAVFECYDVEDKAISLIGCDELEEIRFVEYSIVKRISFRDSPKLSVESIDSIINGLETVDEQTKLTLHSDVVEKLTDEQWQVIYDKNWTVG